GGGGGGGGGRGGRRGGGRRGGAGGGRGAGCRCARSGGGRAVKRRKIEPAQWLGRTKDRQGVRDARQDAPDERVRDARLLPLGSPWVRLCASGPTRTSRVPSPHPARD